MRENRAATPDHYEKTTPRAQTSYFAESLSIHRKETRITVVRERPEVIWKLKAGISRRRSGKREIILRVIPSISLSLSRSLSLSVLSFTKLSQNQTWTFPWTLDSNEERSGAFLPFPRNPCSPSRSVIRGFH